MTIINPKSIAGVTSITTPSGSDNLFTVHTNNTTERVRINNDGDVIVGSGITVSPDGDIFATGVTTATTFVGALTGTASGNAVLTGSTNNQLVTVTGANAITGESALTFDGNLLKLQVDSGEFRIEAANGVDAFTVDSDNGNSYIGGRLLLGTTTEGQASADDLTLATSGNTGITLRSGTSNTGNIYFSDATSGTAEYAGYVSYSHSTNALSFGTNDGTERLRINSTGQLLSGVTGNAGASDANAVFGGGTAGTGNYGKLYITQSTSNPSSGTAIGFIGFSNQDLDNKPFAFMGVYADADHGTNDYPSRFAFWTTPDGSSSASERMRITSGGKLLIGRTSNSGYDNLLQTKSITVETDADATGMQFNRTDSNAAWVAMRFRVQGNQSGYIQVNTSSTQYSTSSDYRLKENVVPLSDGIARLKTLQPYRFNFIEDPTKTVDGFFAHEVTAVPEAVSGEKDAVDSEGNIDPQGIDQSKLVPLLTAALQEAVTKIEVLETRLNNAGIAT